MAWVYKLAIFNPKTVLPNIFLHFSSLPDYVFTYWFLLVYKIISVYAQRGGLASEVVKSAQVPRPARVITFQ